MTNREVAERLLDHARTLQRGQLFRARAYRQAAMLLQGLDRPVTELGEDALARLPGLGEHLAFTIHHLARTGELLTWPERKGRRSAA